MSFLFPPKRNHLKINRAKKGKSIDKPDFQKCSQKTKTRHFPENEPRGHRGGDPKIDRLPRFQNGITQNLTTCTRRLFNFTLLLVYYKRWHLKMISGVRNCCGWKRNLRFRKLDHRMNSKLVRAHHHWRALYFVPDGGRIQDPLTSSTTMLN